LIGIDLDHALLLVNVKRAIATIPPLLHLLNPLPPTTNRDRETVIQRRNTNGKVDLFRQMITNLVAVPFLPRLAASNTKTNVMNNYTNRAKTLLMPPPSLRKNPPPSRGKNWKRSGGRRRDIAREPRHLADDGTMTMTAVGKEEKEEEVERIDLLVPMEEEEEEHEEERDLLTL